ncbi:hypothetical protein Tco_0436459 [Tanacetum coccineum]
MDRLSPGAVNSYDLLKKDFIQTNCPSSKTAKHLEEICNFKRKVTKHYTNPKNGIMTCFINAQLTISIAIRRNIDSSSKSEGIDAIISKLDSLGRDMKKLKKNIHAIQVGCQTCGGAHLDKECPLSEEVKSMEEVKYGEFGRPFPNNNRNDGRFNKGISGYGTHNQPSSGIYTECAREAISCKEAFQTELVRCYTSDDD